MSPTVGRPAGSRSRPAYPAGSADPGTVTGVSPAGAAPLGGIVEDKSHKGTGKDTGTVRKARVATT
jgi:hypothetical protein